MNFKIIFSLGLMLFTTNLVAYESYYAVWAAAQAAQAAAVYGQTVTRPSSGRPSQVAPQQARRDSAQPSSSQAISSQMEQDLEGHGRFVSRARQKLLSLEETLDSKERSLETIIAGVLMALNDKTRNRQKLINESLLSLSNELVIMLKFIVDYLKNLRILQQACRIAEYEFAPRLNFIQGHYQSLGFWDLRIQARMEDILNRSINKSRDLISFYGSKIGSKERAAYDLVVKKTFSNPAHQNDNLWASGKIFQAINPSSGKQFLPLTQKKLEIMGHTQLMYHYLKQRVGYKRFLEGSRARPVSHALPLPAEEGCFLRGLLGLVPKSPVASNPASGSDESLR